MKKLAFIICFLLSFSTLTAQETYTVNGETLQLKTQVEGQIDLLWNVIDNRYRYFIRTADGTITELKNTRNQNNDYQEEFKTVLKNSTSNTISTDDVNLTLSSLTHFFDTYNKSVDAQYILVEKEGTAELRLGVFGGISNSPFVKNPDNIKTPVIGAELEVLPSNNSKHSGFLQLRSTFKNDDFEYSTTEISLGYRFRIINCEKFGFYADTKFATVNFSKSKQAYLDENENLIVENLNETAFDVPFVFGIGAEYRVSENSLITFGYNQLFAAFIDNQGNFPVDFTLGYKLRL